MSVPTSRRAMLAGAATLGTASAVNLAAIVVTRAAATPDPIYAAIERRRVTERAHAAACEGLNPIERRWYKIAPSEPSTAIPINLTKDVMATVDTSNPDTLNHIWVRHCRSAKEIDEALATNCNSKQHQEIRKLARRRLHAAKVEYRRAELKAGITQARHRQYAACHANAAASRDLLQTVPTTTAGLLAMVQYVCECEDAGDAVLEVCFPQESGGDIMGYNVLLETIALSLQAGYPQETLS